MTIQLRAENRAEVQPAPGPILQECRMREAELAASESRSEPSSAELAFRIFAALRAHPHINNVLTHISRAKWAELEKSLDHILDLATTSDGLSPLEENIIDLMVGERGVTGRILKPYYQAALHRIVEPGRAERLIRHVDVLYLELEWKAQHPAAPVQSIPAEEADHVTGKPN